MFDKSPIKKINAKELSAMARQPLSEYMKSNQRFIVIACELYWSPCIDKFTQINKHLEEQKQGGGPQSRRYK